LKGHNRLVDSKTSWWLYRFRISTWLYDAFYLHSAAMFEKAAFLCQTEIMMRYYRQ